MMNGGTPSVTVVKQIYYQRFRFGAENRQGRRKNEEILKIKVTNITKGSKLKIFCVKSNGTTDFLHPHPYPHPHPNTLNGTGCEVGVYFHPDFQSDVSIQEISIPWLQINRTKKEKMVAELEKRKAFLPPDFIAACGAVLDQLRKKEEQIKTTDVCLCVHLTVPTVHTGQVYRTYTLTSLIKHDEKGTSLKIEDLSHFSAFVSGQLTTHIFTTEDSPAIEPDTVQVHMEERDSNKQVVWKSDPFLAGKNNIRYKHVISYPVPPYDNNNITEPITEPIVVYLVVRYGSTDLEDSIQFTYKPTVEAVTLLQGKRKPLSPQAFLPSKFMRLGGVDVKAQLQNVVMQRTQGQEFQGLTQSAQAEGTTSSTAITSLALEGCPIALPIYTRGQGANRASSIGGQGGNIATESMSMQGLGMKALMGGQWTNIGTSICDQGANTASSTDGQVTNIANSKSKQGFDMIMGGSESNIFTSMGDQGMNITAAMGGHGSNMATSMKGQGPTMATSMKGQGRNMATSMGGQASNMASSIEGQGSNTATSMGGQRVNIDSPIAGQGFYVANTALLPQSQTFNTIDPAKGQALTNLPSSFGRQQEMDLTASANGMTSFIESSQQGPVLNGDTSSGCQQSGQPCTFQQGYIATQMEDSVQGNNRSSGTEGNVSECLFSGQENPATYNETAPVKAPRLTRIQLTQDRSECQGGGRILLTLPTPDMSTEGEVAGPKEPFANPRQTVDKLEMMRRLQGQSNTSVPGLQESEENFQTRGNPNQTQAAFQQEPLSSLAQETGLNDIQYEDFPGSRSQMSTESQSGMEGLEAQCTNPSDTPISPPGPMNGGLPSNFIIPSSRETEGVHTPSSAGSLPSIDFLNLSSVDLMREIDISMFDQ